GWDGDGAPALYDLGCGTGVGAAACTPTSGRDADVIGIDRSSWAVAEANRTYRELGVRGRARTGDIVRDFPRNGRTAIVLAYAVNELPAASRAALLDRIAAAADAPMLIVEPIAKKDRTWWPEWSARLAPLGIVEHEWRFPAK